MGKEAHLPRLSGEKTKQNHLDESLAGKTGGKNVGTPNQEIIAGLAHFGHALGLAFQVRDDMLGVWATEAELGKLPVGDIYRRKKSLPILHAFQYAQPDDQQAMAKMYNQDAPITQEQAQEVLAIFVRT